MRGIEKLSDCSCFIFSSKNIDFENHELFPGSVWLKKLSYSAEIKLYDTFDRILLNKGFCAYLINNIFLYADEKVVSACRQVKKLPEFFLPEKYLSKDILQCVDKLISPRALIELVVLKGDIEEFSLIDTEEKTVLRCFKIILKHEEKIFHLFAAQSLKGYESYLNRVIKSDIFNESVQAGLSGAAKLILKYCGIDTESYEKKYEKDLTPEIAPCVAFKMLCRVQLNIIYENINGIVNDVDIEFLHDFRVAVRRSRSLFSLFKKILDEESRKKYSLILKEFGKATNMCRDFDVYTENMPVYEKMLPDNLSSGFAPLKSYLIKMRKREHKKLVQYLMSEHFNKLLSKLDEFYSDSSVGCAPDTFENVKSLADVLLFKTYKKMIEEASLLTSESPAEEFHELRITCKKMRYIFEFFKTLYSQKDIKYCVSLLKTLQDVLGRHQDIEIQQAHIVELALKAGGQIEGKEIMMLASGTLGGLLLGEQHSLRAEFVNLFKDFKNKIDEEFLKKMIGEV